MLGEPSAPEAQEILDTMFLRLMNGERILPQPDWPQDPAYIAFVLDALRFPPYDPISDARLAVLERFGSLDMQDLCAEIRHLRTRVQ